MRRVWPNTPWLLLALAVMDWLALRRGLLGHTPTLLALLVAAALAALLLRLCAVVLRLRRPTLRLRHAAESLALLGVMLCLGAGMLNWLPGGPKQKSSSMRQKSALFGLKMLIAIGIWIRCRRPIQCLPVLSK